jgi:choice-of-anchor A domain-containing protein
MKKAQLGFYLLLSVVLLPCTGYATPLGTAGAYNEFIIGSVVQVSTDSQGKVAVGGDATFDNMSVASEVKDPNPPDLVVGGNLSWVNGSVGYFSDINSGSPEYKQGSIVVGGNAYIGLNQGGSSVAYGSLATNVSPLPIDFAAEEAYLQSMSSFWGDLAPTGTTSVQPGEIFLTGNDPFLNVFTLSASDIVQDIGFHINVPDGATTLVNIAGELAQMQNFGFYFNDLDANYDTEGLFPDTLILYNFFEATDLTIAGIEVHGSILAPWADILFDNGHIEGNLIAMSLIGTGEAHDEPFGGKLPPRPIPEPATLILLCSGLAGVAAWRRRK